MSHRKQRVEPQCLNCFSKTYGRYCHICGQENVEPKETFWGLVTHFVYDITHFDGKFFSSLKYLIFYPGFLSKEYLRGRRASYLNPIRMYVFSSALFFIIFFSFIDKSNVIDFKTSQQVRIELQPDSIEKYLPMSVDSIERKQIKTSIDSIRASFKKRSPLSQADSAEAAPKSNDDFNFDFGDSSRTIKEYDSVQNSLPKSERDGWLMRQLNRKAITTKTKFHDNKELFSERLKEKFLHSFPQIMFLSLPLVAFILYVLNIRHRKTYYYVNHIIFAVHVYIALYILILIAYGFSLLNDLTHIAFFKFLQTITIFAILYYIYKAMRNFYMQGRGKTVLKYVMLFVSSTIIIALLLIVFLITSILQV